LAFGFGTVGAFLEATLPARWVSTPGLHAAT
jgi:hypothetical protein